MHILSEIIVIMIFSVFASWKNVNLSDPVRIFIRSIILLLILSCFELLQRKIRIN